MQEYTINDLVSLTGVARRNIHFYVQQGLLPPPAGAGLGARYSDEHLSRLREIPILRNRGLRLDEIRERLAGSGEGSITNVLTGAPQTQPPAQIPRCGTGLLPHGANPGNPGAPKAQHVVRYRLAPGVELLVDGANPAAHAQVAELIEEAKKIFRLNPDHNGGDL